MFLLTSHIYIGELEFDFVAGISIRQSLKEATNTATITIPKRVRVNKYENKEYKPIQEIIKAGDAVRIELGYDGKNRVEFVGFVKQVNPKVSLEIECEDQMYVLKRLKVAPKKVTGKLADLIRYVAGDYYRNAILLDTELGGPFLVGTDDSDTAMKVLEKVEEVYGLKSTFILINGTPTLCVGTQYTALSTSKPVKYILNENVIDNDLEYIRSEDVKISVQAKSRQSNGKVLTAKFKGDDDGDSRSISVPGISQSQLEQMAKDLYLKAKAAKFDGGMTGFGLPFAMAGMRAEITGIEYEVKNTVNFIDEAEITFGTDGFRRRITLGPKAA